MEITVDDMLLKCVTSFAAMRFSRGTLSAVWLSKIETSTKNGTEKTLFCIEQLTMGWRLLAPSTNFDCNTILKSKNDVTINATNVLQIEISNCRIYIYLEHTNWHSKFDIRLRVSAQQR